MDRLIFLQTGHDQIGHFFRLFNDLSDVPCACFLNDDRLNDKLDALFQIIKSSLLFLFISNFVVRIIRQLRDFPVILDHVSYAALHADSLIIVGYEFIECKIPVKCRRRDYQDVGKHVVIKNTDAESFLDHVSVLNGHNIFVRLKFPVDDSHSVLPSDDSLICK